MRMTASHNEVTDSFVENRMTAMREFCGGPSAAGDSFALHYDTLRKAS